MSRDETQSIASLCSLSEFDRLADTNSGENFFLRPIFSMLQSTEGVSIIATEAMAA